MLSIWFLVNIRLYVVFNPNHYFGFGRILKPNFGLLLPLCPEGAEIITLGFQVSDPYF